MKKVLFVIFMLLFMINLNASSKGNYNNYQDYLNTFFDAILNNDFFEEGSISLITKNEYDYIGKDSYFNNGKETLTSSLLEESVYYISENGDVLTSLKTDNKSLKATLKIKPDVYVLGYGSEKKPYKFVSMDDIVISSITIDGVSVVSTPTSGHYKLNGFCDEGNVIWDNVNYEVIIDTNIYPVVCALEFESI